MELKDYLYFETASGKIYNGSALKVLKAMPDESVNMCMTSPPYWSLRQYLPDVVALKKDAPDWVLKELEKLKIKSLD